MKNKLWVFGCSFSTGMNLVDPLDEDKLRISWPYVLADKLDLELVNSAHPGQCNWVSILQFIDRRDEIQPGDKVVFEFTFFDRYNIYPTKAQLIDLEAYFIKHHGTFADNLIEMRNVNYKWFKKQVNDWCIKNKIPIYYWSAEGQTHSDFKKYKEIINFIPAPNSTNEFTNYSFYTKWQDQLEEQHIIEPNGNIDKHFNELGHQRMANHFFEYINTYRKSLL
jgi:hypothetical protein